MNALEDHQLFFHNSPSFTGLPIALTKKKQTPNHHPKTTPAKKKKNKHPRPF